MEDGRFDSLVKSLASGSTRRSVLKGLLGLGAAASAGGTLLGADTQAARRPTPTPKPPTCPGSQHWDGTQCVCTSGQICGSDCCLLGSECCDGACCFGHCYGEELCCSPENWCEDTGECCPDGAVYCFDQGCVVVQPGECGCDGVCPEEYECCGDQCCVRGYCAGGEICCATGVCGNACLPSPEWECCGVTSYDPSVSGCCDGTVYTLEGNVCCDGDVYTGRCCIDSDCGSCSRCENHRCTIATC